MQYGDGSGRSAEHPDPEPFDGASKRLPHFLCEMALKLRANNDWYPTEDSKLIYYISRLKGKAFGQVQGRIDQDGNINFANVAEVVAILQVAFGELDEKSDVPAAHDAMVTCFRNVDAQDRMADSSYYKKGNSNAPTDTRAPTIPAYYSPITNAADDAMDLSLLNIAGNVTWTAQDVASARRPQNAAEQAARKLYNTKHGLCHWCSSDKHKAPSCTDAPWNKGGEGKKTIQGKA